MTDFYALAKGCGFYTAAKLDVSTLEFLPDVRSMCAADKCQHYDKTWACPPACGTLEQFRERSSHYSKGILLQTVGEREDSFDFESMTEVAGQSDKNFDKLTAALRKKGVDFMAMSAGTCTRCAKCTYPDAPCRFPEMLYPSMEAGGLFVSKVCKDNGVSYYYGDDKIAYTCCVLYND